MMSFRIPVLTLLVLTSTHEVLGGDNYEGCPGWAKRGDCTAHSRFMMAECEASCGWVNPGHPAAAGSVELPDCVPWAQRGECQNNPGYMLVKCPRACAAASPAKGGCGDDDGNCSGWAAHDQCKVNPGYMLVHCKKSCKVCQDSSAVEQEEATTEQGGEKVLDVGVGSSISALIGRLLPNIQNEAERKK